MQSDAPTDKQCIHCGLPPNTDIPSWNIILGYKQPPTTHILLIPEEGRAAAVSADLKKLQYVAPHRVEVLRRTDARLPLEMALPLPQANTQTSVLISLSNTGDQKTSPNDGMM